MDIMSENTQLAHSLELKPRTRDVILEENISFQSLFLPDKILQGLSDTGFQKPSPVQKKALPIGRCGFDLIVQSKSGTGKTLVFSIIALESLKLNANQPQVLILSPTREIAVQIQDVVKSIGKYFEGLQVNSFIGGLPYESDKLKCKCCHIAVGTPGRIKQLIQSGFLSTGSIKLFILDEADKLVESSFQNDINEIYNALPERKQILMCSATYSNDLKEFLNNYMLSPTYINVELETPLLLGLKYFVRLLKSLPNIVQQIKVKNEDVLSILSNISFTQCLIFSNYQTRAESISNFLNRNGWNSTFISSAQDQNDRLSSLSSLKDFKCRIMVSTDLTARGIDSANVDLVINYDIPIDAMTYLHRMGRAGRYGSSGICINLALLGDETKKLQSILGIIGGETMSVPILNDDLNIESSNHEILASIIPENIKEFTEKCKTQVMEMKKKIKRKATKVEKNIDSVLKKVQDDESFEKVVLNKLPTADTTDILQQLASGSFDLTTCHNSDINTIHSLDNVSDEQNIKTLVQEKLADTDSLDILNQLAAGTFGMDSNQKENDVDTVSILEHLANQTYKGFSNENKEEKKRKRSSSSISSPSQEISKEELFCKNRALFGVAKSISNIETDKDDTEYLAQYLSVLKAKEYEEYHQVFDKNQEHDILELENIFLVAYKSQVLKDNPAWQSLIPADDKWKLEEIQVDLEDHDEEYDEDYDFEMEKDIEVNYTKNMLENHSENPNDYSFMKWIPVEPTAFTRENNRETTSSISNSSDKKLEVYSETTVDLAKQTDFLHYHDQYRNYYHQASENLWQTGLHFNNIQSFDEWFCYDWQNQVSSIRNFIQQKIYIDEMNRYQGEQKKNYKN